MDISKEDLAKGRDMVRDFCGRHRDFAKVATGMCMLACVSMVNPLYTLSPYTAITLFSPPVVISGVGALFSELTETSAMEGLKYCWSGAQYVKSCVKDITSSTKKVCAAAEEAAPAPRAAAAASLPQIESSSEDRGRSYVPSSKKREHTPGAPARVRELNEEGEEGEDVDDDYDVFRMPAPVPAREQDRVRDPAPVQKKTVLKKVLPRNSYSANK
jgi:hypothetical protein